MSDISYSRLCCLARVYFVGCFVQNVYRADSDSTCWNIIIRHSSGSVNAVISVNQFFFYEIWYYLSAISEVIEWRVGFTNDISLCQYNIEYDMSNVRLA